MAGAGDHLSATPGCRVRDRIDLVEIAPQCQARLRDPVQSLGGSPVAQRPQHVRRGNVAEVCRNRRLFGTAVGEASGERVGNTLGEQVRQLAYRDGLTGVFNRRYFETRILEEIARADRYQSEVSVLMIDIDRFKQLNDSCGHAAGDQVLRQFAGALRRAARSTDILARIGGDEFGVLLIRCDERAAHSFMIRLRDAMEETPWPALAQIGASLGQASLLESTSPEKALHRADLAMLARKRSSYVL